MQKKPLYIKRVRRKHAQISEKLGGLIPIFAVMRRPQSLTMINVTIVRNKSLRQMNCKVR